MQLWLVRHAPTAVEGLCYGHSEVPTQLGATAAAEAVARAMEPRAPAIEEIWSSPWARAREPAELLAARWRLPLRIDPRLSELCFGEWESRRYDEIERSDGKRFAAWCQRWKTEAPPGGESLPMLRARVRGWLSERTGASGVLVLTHAGVIRALRMELLGMDAEAAWAQAVEHLVPICLEAGSDGQRAAEAAGISASKGI